MDPESDTLPLEKQPLGRWGRFLRFLKIYRHFVRSVLIATGLILFLSLLPAYVRSALLRGFRVQPYLSVMLFIFGALALSLLWSTGQRIDAWAFLFVNLRGRRARWLDLVMLGFTQLGSGAISLLIALGLILTGTRRLAYELILGTLSLWLLVELLKALVRRSRPFVNLSQTRIVGYRANGRSFPSGHTSQAFFLATLMVQYFHLSPASSILLYALAILVAVTRMYVGAHYPRDVLGGAILGTIWGLLGSIIDAYFMVGRP